jgi:hypothetical protein
VCRADRSPGLPTAAPVRFTDGWVLRHGIAADDPHGYYPRACYGPVEPTCIDPALTETVAAPGAFSPWIEVSAMFDGGWRASHAWDVTNATTGAPLNDTTVQVQLAWAPDPAAVLWDDTRLGWRVSMPRPPCLAAQGDATLGSCSQHERTARRPTRSRDPHPSSTR